MLYISFKIKELRGKIGWNVIDFKACEANGYLFKRLNIVDDDDAPTWLHWIDNRNINYK